MRARKLRIQTEDVQNRKSISFQQMLLCEQVLKGLKEAGFETPSPVQSAAIPKACLVRDLIVQSKSGTGKTLVFVIAALENLVRYKSAETSLSCSMQTLIIAPSREIAIQIHQVMLMIGKYMESLQTFTFIGGIDVKQDIDNLKSGCNIAIGTPGRILHLLKDGHMKLNHLRLVCIDEVDQLLVKGYESELVEILTFNGMPEYGLKRTIAVSATFNQQALDLLDRVLNCPDQVMLAPGSASLKGVSQYFIEIGQVEEYAAFAAKVEEMLLLLRKVPFHQCIIFSNYKPRAEELTTTLSSCGWPAVCLAGGMEQSERISAISQIRSFQARVLVSTDLGARGVDLDRVTLVVNLDLPKDHDTFLHRVGRTGRFGTLGTCISLVSAGELHRLYKYSRRTQSQLSRFCYKQIGSLSSEYMTSEENSDLERMNQIADSVKDEQFQETLEQVPRIMNDKEEVCIQQDAFEHRVENEACSSLGIEISTPEENSFPFNIISQKRKLSTFLFPNQ